MKLCSGSQNPKPNYSSDGFIPLGDQAWVSIPGSPSICRWKWRRVGWSFPSKDENKVSQALLLDLRPLYIVWHIFLEYLGLPKVIGAGFPTETHSKLDPQEKRVGFPAEFLHQPAPDNVHRT